VRQRIDADAELADGVRLLEEFAVDPAGVQHQRRDQPADAGACDNHLHDDTPATHACYGPVCRGGQKMQ